MMKMMYHSAATEAIDKVTLVCSAFPAAYAAGDISATFSKMEMQLSPFLSATWGCGRNPGPNEVINRRRSRTCIPTKNG